MVSNVGKVLKTAIGFILLVTGVLSFCGSVLASVQGTFPLLGNPFLLVTQMLMCLGGILLIKHKKKADTNSFFPKEDSVVEVERSSDLVLENSIHKEIESVDTNQKEAGFCRYCGSSLRKGAKFCEFCGKNIQ